MSLEARIAELNENVVKLIHVLSNGQQIKPTEVQQPDKASTKTDKPTSTPEKPKAEAATQTDAADAPSVDVAALRKEIGELVLAKAKTNREAVVKAIDTAQPGAKRLGEVADDKLPQVKVALEALP